MFSSVIYLNYTPKNSKEDFFPINQNRKKACKWGKKVCK